MEQTEALVFEHLLENMTDGVFLVGYDGHIRMENTIAADMLEVKDSVLYGKTMVELISADSRNDEFYECITLAVFKNERISDIVPFYNKSGKRLLRLVVSPLRDREENIAAIVMLSDVTEITELGRKNEFLNKKLVDFIDRFVKVMIGAIDKRSHFNATHTKKMVAYAMKYLIYLEEQGRGISEEKKAPFIASVWMHDVGKIVIPYNILEKQNRLGGKEKDIKNKVEVAILCDRLKIMELSEKTKSEIESETKSKIEIEIKDINQHIEDLQNAYEFIISINNNGIIDDETKERVYEIAKLRCDTYSGGTVNLLDEYDVEALTVERGNLTPFERKKVNSHAAETYEILSQMNFEGPYKDVPKWAGRHHEFLDGTGYPEGLTGKDISWETRVLTIIDIYDALTADDRPYKPPLSPEKAFSILEEMRDEGKIDGEILEDFKESGAWRK